MAKVAQLFAFFPTLPYLVINSEVLLINARPVGREDHMSLVLTGLSMSGGATGFTSADPPVPMARAAQR